MHSSYDTMLVRIPFIYFFLLSLFLFFCFLFLFLNMLETMYDIPNFAPHGADNIISSIKVEKCIPIINFIVIIHY